MFNNTSRGNNSNQPGLPAGGAATIVFHDNLIQNSIRATESHQISKGTRKDHCNRLDKMIKWVEEQVAQGKFTISDPLTCALTEEQKSDKLNYHNSERDFVYEILPAMLVQAYISTHKNKPTSTIQKPEHYGYDTLRKYADAVLYGATRSKKLLSVEYKQSMKVFLDSLEKECVAAKKRGEVVNEEADPIRFPLYRLICDYAIHIGDAFLWAYTTLLWNCMARPINIDDISMQNFTLGQDSVVVQFDETKTDKKGKKCAPKNCYAHPLDHVVCLNTAMATYLMVIDNEWDGDKSSLFILPGASKGTGSKRYNDKFDELQKRLREKLAEFVRPDHFGPYGFRKGAATHAATSTTAPPSPVSIMLRGEWSLGEVLDVYWRFSEGGDMYLGRVLAGLSPNLPTFDTLPPHFLVGCENPDVKTALNICFPKIMAKANGNDSLLHVRGLLLRYLASLVYHSDKLMQSPFKDKIALFFDKQHLSRLKALITVGISNIIVGATGIPPQVEHGKQLARIEDMLKEEKLARQTFKNDLFNTIIDAINEKAASAGQITSTVLENMFQRHQQNLNELLTERLGASQTQQTSNPTQASSGNTVMMTRGGYPVYSYQGKMDWDVPSDWTVPKSNLKNAFILWFFGVSNETGVIIRPFRHLKVVPVKEWRKFKVEFIPIMKLMEEGVDTQSITMDTYLNEYEKGVKCVESQVSFIKKCKKASTWTVATWSSRIKRSSILKNGTDEDKEKVSMESRYNKKHSKKRVFRASSSKVAKEARLTQGLESMFGIN